MEKAQHESDCEFLRRETPGIERKLFRSNLGKCSDDLVGRGRSLFVIH